MEDTPLQHFKSNKEFYRKISEQLDQIRELFKDAHIREQRRAIIDSYIFSVLSVQTPLERHEAAFRAYIEGDRELETEEMQSVNYWKNKTNYIRATETRFEEIDMAILDLQTGKLDSAHRVIADNFKGVSTVKAAFTMAMLGFKDKMCIDTNARQAAGLEQEELYDGKVIEKYEQQCTEIRQEFPELSSELEPFMVQWVLFDHQRGETADHKVLIDHLLNTLSQ